MLAPPTAEDLALVDKALSGGCACGKCAVITRSVTAVLAAVMNDESRGTVLHHYVQLAEAAPAKIAAEEARTRLHHAELVATIQAAVQRVSPSPEEIALAGSGEKKH